VQALPPDVLAAAERLTGSLGLREGEGGEREIFLCHTTCELGATRLSDALEDYRKVLDRNPSEVVILFVEPYVEPADFALAVEQAGLDDRVRTLELDGPMPTLGQLVADDRPDRLVGHRRLLAQLRGAIGERLAVQHPLAIHVVWAGTGLHCVGTSCRLSPAP